MCREKGRRCPCDTSAARQARRVNAKSRASVETTQNPAQSFAPAHRYYDGYTPTDNPQKNIEALRERAKIHMDELNAPYPERRPDMSEEEKEEIFAILDRRRDAPGKLRIVAQEMGHNVSLLAEDKAGFTHDDMEKVLAQQKQARAETDELRDQLYGGDVPLQEREAVRERLQEAHEREVESRDKFKQMSEDMGLAYREAVSFAAGEELGAGEQGLQITEHASAQHKRAAKVLEEDLDCYPRSWIEESNEVGKLLPRFSKRRAHYHEEGKIVTTGTRIVPTIQRYMTPDIEHEYEPLTEKEKASINMDAYTPEAQESMYKKVEWTYYREWEHGSLQENGLPRGRGWQKKTVWVRNWHNKDEVEYIQKDHIMRRKPSRNKTATGGAFVSEITIPEDKRPAGERSNATSIHEFAHRSEHTMPHLARMEYAFLSHRRGEDEELVEIYKGRDEMAYADSFSTTYSGKVYDGRAYEIMSMGMESLMGRHTKEPRDRLSTMWSQEGKMDTEYRDFVLGALSTVKPKKKD